MRRSRYITTQILFGVYVYKNIETLIPIAIKITIFFYRMNVSKISQWKDYICVSIKFSKTGLLRSHKKHTILFDNVHKMKYCSDLN